MRKEESEARDMDCYEEAARAAGFEVRQFGGAWKIARHKSDGVYALSERGWRYACEDSGIEVSVEE